MKVFSIYVAIQGLLLFQCGAGRTLGKHASHVLCFHPCGTCLLHLSHRRGPTINSISDIKRSRFCFSAARMALERIVDDDMNRGSFMVSLIAQSVFLRSKYISTMKIISHLKNLLLRTFDRGR